MLGHALNKQNSQDFVTVAPQGPNETSCNPKYKKFTVIKRVKNNNSKAKSAIIEINYKDEDIPYVEKINEKLVTRNYKPSSLYTTRNMAHSKQSHKFVDKSETIKPGRHKNKNKKQTRKMRNDNFHKNQLNSLMHNCIEGNISKNQACFKCGEQAH